MVFGKKRSTKQTPVASPEPRRFSMPVLSEDGCEVVPQFFPSGQYQPTMVPACRRAGAIKLAQPTQLDEYGRRCSNASTLSTTSTLYPTHGDVCYNTRRAGSIVRHDSQEKYLNRRRHTTIQRTTKSTVSLQRSDSNKTIVVPKPQTAPHPPKVESPNLSDSAMASRVFGRPQTAYLPPREHSLSITN